MLTDSRSLEVLPTRECLALLAGAEVARVIFTEHALPAVVPVTVAVLDESVYFRTTPDSRLASLADGCVLTVQADAVDTVSRTGWSVVATGLAEVVTDPLRRAVVESVVTPWAPGDHTVCVRVPLTAITGRRVAA
jgi:nitroimidazol reductase NimA-like FMN-containing flavoprotein (pyridoxamine 5'-phosphate oxidase superfamily)